jgi:hypothetical protein
MGVLVRANGLGGRFRPMNFKQVVQTAAHGVPETFGYARVGMAA